MKAGPRGKRQDIVDEKLVRTGDGMAYLYEVLKCGHFQRGVYNRHGESSSARGTPVRSRICRQCLMKKPAVPPGEIVEL